MHEQRTIVEHTYRPSPSSPPCVIRVDPDPLSHRRIGHEARWTWTEEEAMFFTSVVLEILAGRKDAKHLHTPIAAIREQIDILLNVWTGSVSTATKKKRLSIPKKGA